MIRYVWLDMDNGKFSNSWSEEEHLKYGANLVEETNGTNWKLLKYICENDKDFEFVNLMRLA